MTDETIEGLAAVLRADEFLGWDKISLEPRYLSKKPDHTTIIQLRRVIREEALSRGMYHTAATLGGR